MKTHGLFIVLRGPREHNVIWIWMNLDVPGCLRMDPDESGLARAGAPILTLTVGADCEAFQGTVRIGCLGCLGGSRTFSSVPKGSVVGVGVCEVLKGLQGAQCHMNPNGSG